MFRHLTNSELSIALVSVVLNIAVITIISINKHLHTPTNIIICHLAIADVMVGVFAGIWTILTYVITEIDFQYCLCINCIFLVVDGVPVILIVMVAAIRFVAVRFPSFYKASLSTTRVMTLAGICWILGILHVLVPYFWSNTSDDYDKTKCTLLAVIPINYLLYLDIVFKFLFPMFTMSVLYAGIAHILKKRPHSTFEHITSGKLFKSIILVHLLCAMPIVVIHILEFFDIHPPYTVEYVCILLTRGNSVLNPFIYAFSNKNIVTALKRFFCNKNCDHDVPSVDRAAPINTTVLNSPLRRSPIIHSKQESAVNREQIQADLIQTNTLVPLRSAEPMQDITETPDKSSDPAIKVVKSRTSHLNVNEEITDNVEPSHTIPAHGRGSFELTKSTVQVILSKDEV